MKSLSFVIWFLKMEFLEEASMGILVKVGYWRKVLGREGAREAG